MHQQINLAHCSGSKWQVLYEATKSNLFLLLIFIRFYQRISYIYPELDVHDQQIVQGQVVTSSPSTVKEPGNELLGFLPEGIVKVISGDRGNLDLGEGAVSQNNPVKLSSGRRRDGTTSLETWLSRGQRKTLGSRGRRFGSAVSYASSWPSPSWCAAAFVHRMLCHK